MKQLASDEYSILDDRMRYYKALEQVQVNHESDLFYELIVEHVESSQKEHLHLAGAAE